MSINGEGTPDISEMIKGVMQNPEFAGLVKELRGDEGKNTSDIQSDIMSKLPEIMSMLGPRVNGQSDSRKNENNTKSSKDEGRADPGAAKLLKKLDKFDKTKATRLMSAIKPYLSRERCDMIDKCMSVIQIGDVMAVLRGMDSYGKRDD